MPERSFTIRVVGEEMHIEAASGQRLVLALEDAGIDILHRCGGNARCATCRCEIESGDAGEPTPWETDRLSRIADRTESTRLACQVRVEDDLTVTVRRRLHQNPELGDAGPRPIDWPSDRALEPEA